MKNFQMKSGGRYSKKRKVCEESEQCLPIFAQRFSERLFIPC